MGPIKNGNVLAGEHDRAGLVRVLQCGDPGIAGFVGVAGAEIDHAYLTWGLIGVEGLEIDGAEATAAGLIEAGPVELAAEILARIKAECGLSEDERKN